MLISPISGNLIRRMETFIKKITIFICSWWSTTSQKPKIEIIWVTRRWRLLPRMWPLLYAADDMLIAKIPKIEMVLLIKHDHSHIQLREYYHLKTKMDAKVQMNEMINSALLAQPVIKTQIHNFYSKCTFR